MTEQQDFQNWELDKLSDHIVDTHHVYARKASSQILETANQVSKAYAEKYPELSEITEKFETLAEDLEKHMVGEEKYLFPYVKKLLAAKREGNKLPKPGFGSLDVPLKNHYEDHDHADKLMKEIRKLSNGFALPNDASDAYESLYRQLKEFEADLEQHIYVENEVLFGRSIQLENEVVG